MDIWLIVIVLIPLIAAIFGAIAVSGKKNAFVGLGNIRGKSIGEITAAVGPPNSISGQADGTLYQWIGTTSGGAYHYAILFDLEGRAIGYTHQHVS
jgi:hypothetical protein